jgi:hypothetical protein
MPTECPWKCSRWVVFVEGEGMAVHGCGQLATAKRAHKLHGLLMALPSRPSPSKHGCLRSAGFCKQPQPQLLADGGMLHTCWGGLATWHPGATLLQPRRPQHHRPALRVSDRSESSTQRSHSGMPDGDIRHQAKQLHHHKELLCFMGVADACLRVTATGWMLHPPSVVHACTSR